MRLSSYVAGEWVAGTGSGTPIFHAVTGEQIFEADTTGIDFQQMLAWGRAGGGTALRAMTFHERARMLKGLAKYLMSRKEELYALSTATGATRGDSWIDIEGGIGTLFTYASKGRRELPDKPFHIEGPPERISKNNTFTGQHICVPLEGIAVHINAFNFPCWGMLEKLGATFLAGMPAVVKPATVSCYVARKAVELMLESGLLPQGALQVVCGSLGDTFQALDFEDVVTFTGSKSTGTTLRGHPRIIDQSVRFNLETDSLNSAFLGPDAEPGTEEFELFIKEVAKEMTVKAGQKCTVIRRVIVPRTLEQPVLEALRERLSKVVIGDPALQEVRMGPLVSRDQVADVRAQVERLHTSSELVHGSFEGLQVVGADPERGAFFPHVVLHCKKPFEAVEPHEVEAFGPVTTVMGYESLEEAGELGRRGGGSLCGSIFTADDSIARELALAAAPYHGRLLLMNRYCAKESTGHGSPLPHLVHGGPGRAGGGEELGGVRSVMHYMQRTALQGSPQRLSVVCGRWLGGEGGKEDRIHPFRKYFEELEIGETLVTHRRTITETDVVNFAALSGDHFYAHTDEIAAERSVFGRRVAHGYLILAVAAGLFVSPAPGPVIANYGLENLRFIKPVYIGDTVHVRLTVKEKTPKDLEARGVISWDVEVLNQINELVASYTILTLVERLHSPSESGDGSTPLREGAKVP